MLNASYFREWYEWLLYKMKITAILKKFIYSEGVNPLPAKLFSLLFALMVRVYLWNNLF